MGEVKYLITLKKKDYTVLLTLLIQSMAYGLFYYYHTVIAFIEIVVKDYSKIFLRQKWCSSGQLYETDSWPWNGF